MGSPPACANHSELIDYLREDWFFAAFEIASDIFQDTRELLRGEIRVIEQEAGARPNTGHEHDIPGELGHPRGGSPPPARQSNHPQAQGSSQTQLGHCLPANGKLLVLDS